MHSPRIGETYCLLLFVSLCGWRGLSGHGGEEKNPSSSKRGLPDSQAGRPSGSVTSYLPCRGRTSCYSRHSLITLASLGTAKKFSSARGHKSDTDKAAHDSGNGLCTSSGRLATYALAHIRSRIRPLMLDL